MSPIVYRITALLEQLLVGVPIGTNLGLYHMLFALLSGHFLAERGAVFPALKRLGLTKDAVHHASAALREGRWMIATLLQNWRNWISQEGSFVPHRHRGYHPVPCDLTAFYRPQLRGLQSKHYCQVADKALPAIVFGVAVRVGSVGKQRLGIPTLLLRGEATESDANLERRLVQTVAKSMKPDEVIVVDAGFDLSDLLATGKSFVIRLPKNATVRRNFLPEYKGKGRPPEYGEIVRPLPRTHSGKEIAGTPSDTTASWQEGTRQFKAHLFSEVVKKADAPGGHTFHVVAIYDPRYKEPLLLATNLLVSAEALLSLYRDRWAVEQLPLSAKPMLGCERAFVFGEESRYRLPELSLLCGNILSYLSACSAPVASGFWDRACRPTCGRLRRVLNRLDFSKLPSPVGQLRKKSSVTGHLLTGVRGHRRQKANAIQTNPLNTL